MKVLVIVDMQNDFISGSLGTKEAVAIVDQVVQKIRNASDALVLFTLDTHQEDYLDTPEGQKLPVIHCLEGSDGWQIHQDVFNAWNEKKDRIVVPELVNNSFNKPVFGSVALVDFLKSQAETITEIELIGVCTDICVISNAIMIKNTLPHIKISVDSSCCAGVTPESHKEALNTMKMCQIDVY